MNKKLVIIDGDGLLYHSSKETLEESIESINDRINNIFIKTKIDFYILFISNGRYFRHSIDPNYKLKRTAYPTQLKWIKTLKAYLIENWKAQWMDNAEADDLVAYWYNHSIWFNPEYIVTKPLIMTFRNSITPYNTESNPSSYLMEKIICSPDKDILQSIPGKHFNYSYKLENKEDPNSIVKGWWVETTEYNTRLNFWNSMVCGDVTDGIKGIEGRGITYANKMYDVENKQYESICLKEYIHKYGISQGIYEFQKNYRLLHLLDCDEDFMREIHKLPEFPVISEVPKIQVPQVVESNYEF